MATAKKATTRTASARTKASVKKVATKSAPKKAAPKKRSSAKQAAASASYASFKVRKDADSFTNFKITRQTIYWIILIAFIIFAQLWIIKLQVEIAGLLDAQQSQLLEPN